VEMSRSNIHLMLRFLAIKTYNPHLLHVMLMTKKDGWDCVSSSWLFTRLIPGLRRRCLGKTKQQSRQME